MKTTDELTKVLLKAKPGEVADILIENESMLADSAKPFPSYMRELFQKKGLKRQEVFLAADISEGYGYKLLSGEKHTRRRDVILRLCFAAHFSLDEMQRALKLYGFSPLYPRIPRDAVLMVAANTSLYHIEDVNALLCDHGMESLQSCGEQEF